MEALGKMLWAIADGYIPAWSTGQAPEFTSHEAFCLLNTGDAAAHVEVTVFYADREPVGPYVVEVGPRRTSHVRFNDLSDPEPIPRGVEYAAVIRSDVPVIVQHTRLDSRQAENGLFSTMAFPVDTAGE